MAREQQSERIPQKPEERIEWVLKRAGMLDVIRGEDWVRKEMEDLWNNPDEFEAVNTQEVPDGVAKEDYMLFRLGVAFGTDYEHYFPRGEWRDE